MSRSIFGIASLISGSVAGTASASLMSTGTPPSLGIMDLTSMQAQVAEFRQPDLMREVGLFRDGNLVISAVVQGEAPPEPVTLEATAEFGITGTVDVPFIATGTIPRLDLDPFSRLIGVNIRTTATILAQARIHNGDAVPRGVDMDADVRFAVVDPTRPGSDLTAIRLFARDSQRLNPGQTRMLFDSASGESNVDIPMLRLNDWVGPGSLSMNIEATGNLDVFPDPPHVAVSSAKLTATGLTTVTTRFQPIGQIQSDPIFATAVTEGVATLVDVPSNRWISTPDEITPPLTDALIVQASDTDLFTMVGVPIDLASGYSIIDLVSLASVALLPGQSVMFSEPLAVLAVVFSEPQSKPVPILIGTTTETASYAIAPLASDPPIPTPTSASVLLAVGAWCLATGRSLKTRSR